MKKTVILCIGNTLLFTLLGLTFLFPFSEITPNEFEFGFSAHITIFPLLLIVYMIVFPIAYNVLVKKYHWRKKDNSELAYSDEREKIIVADSTKIAYKILISGLLITIAGLGGIKFYSISTGMAINIYFLSIAFLTATLVVTTISYCIRWCLGYKK